MKSSICFILLNSIDGKTALIALIALILVIWLLVKITKGIKPHTEREALQHQVNEYASSTIPSSGKKGCSKTLIFIIIILILICGLLLAWKGNFDLHPFR